MKLYRYRKRRFPTGWDCFDMDTYSKPGIPMQFSRCVIDDMPYQVDDLNADIPIFQCLRAEGVDIADFYEYRGEPKEFNIWPAETADKPLAQKMEDIIGIQLSSTRKP